MKLVPITLVAALLSAAPVAFAASTTDLTVTGVITPAACTPSIGGGGNFEFGRIAAQDLNQDRFTGFDSAYRPLNVVCDAPTRFALRAVDGRSGTSAGIDKAEHAFGLGLNGDEKFGEYQILTNAFIADGSPADSLDSVDGGSNWFSNGSDGATLFNTSIPGLTAAAAVGSTEPLASGTLNTGMKIRLLIAPAEGLTLTDEVPIDGAATLEVVYL